MWRGPSGGPSRSCTAARLMVGDAEGLLPETIVAQSGTWTGIDPPASYQADAVAEAGRLAAERVLTRGMGASTPIQLRDAGPLAAIVRNTTTRARLGARVLMIWEVALEDGTGRCVHSRAIATA